MLNIKSVKQVLNLIKNHFLNNYTTFDKNKCMYRQVFTSTNNQLVLKLPNELVGKVVEIIAHPLEVNVSPKEKRRQDIGNIFSDCRISLSEFSFNRNEANDFNG